MRAFTLRAWLVLLLGVAAVVALLALPRAGPVSREQRRTALSAHVEGPVQRAALQPRLEEPSPHASNRPELPRADVDTTEPRPTGRTIVVSAGDDLQAALRRAQPGDVVTLEAGARFVGNFTLPRKKGDGWIVIRTSAPDGSLPPPGSRVTPAFADRLPKLISPNGAPVLSAAPGAHHYRFVGIELTVAPDVAVTYQLVALGDRSTPLADVPHHLVFDRVYIHGHPRQALRRGIALNSAATAVIDSYISDVHEVGPDSQAIAGWSGPGPFKIVNNYLEASGENLLFGGADPTIRNLVPSDIEIRRNHFDKPLTWRIEDPSYAGTPWTVKNLLELKNARRVLIDGNLFEHNWPHGQGGTAILFTVRNQDGTAPWSAVQDVTFTNNIVRHTGSGITVLGIDGKPSQPTERILIRNNLFDDVSGARWGGLGRLFEAYHGVTDLVIEHNTALQDGLVMMTEGRPHPRFVFRDNIVPLNDYGIDGTDTAPGNDTLRVYFPDAIVEKNVFVGSRHGHYPEGNFGAPSIDAVGFVDPGRGNYRLRDSSPYAHAVRDGSRPGVDLDALCAAMARASHLELIEDHCPLPRPGR